jgi:ketosteroid isomerase-like protein
MYDAWTARDGRHMRRLLATDEQVLVWIDGPAEEFKGRAEIDRNLDASLAKCPPWTQMTVTQRTLSIGDSFAWAADDLTASWADGAHHGTERFWITTILEKRGDAWHITHTHVENVPA